MIQSNSCGRTLSMTVNDLAYLCDIDALNKIIDALTANSHTNNGIMTMALDEFPTIDQGNGTLDEIKAEMENKLNINNLYTKEETDAKYALKSEIGKFDGSVLNIVGESEAGLNLIANHPETEESFRYVDIHNKYTGGHITYEINDDFTGGIVSRTGEPQKTTEKDIGIYFDNTLKTIDITNPYDITAHARIANENDLS